jgi:hypothetical protein
MPAPAGRSYFDIATDLPARVDLHRGIALVPAAAGQIFALSPGGGGGIAGTAGATGAFKLDPADLTLGGHYPVLRVSGIAIPNAVAPNADFTVELRRILTWGGASGSNPTTATTSIIATSSTLSVAALTNTPSNEGVTADIDATVLVPGMYTMSTTSLGTTQTNSITLVIGKLSLSYV